MKKAGIIGSGSVGKVLARGFMENGYETTISSRSEETRNELAKLFNGKVKTDTPENTARNNEIIVFAVKGAKAKEALAILKVENLAGKVVIDTTNPIENVEPVNGVLLYSSSINKSLMEELQAMAPKARFVKAFNSVGSAHMVNPDFKSKPTMFICGEDQAAKNEVKHILDLFGWESEDMGNMEAARAIEPLAMLWCIPRFRENSWNHAFKWLKN